jgi:serine/threonine protein kinase
MKKKSLERVTKIIGTPDYMAPEIIQGRSLVNPTIDWWSFGVIAYEMLVGCRPFSANSVEEILDNIENGEIEWPEIGEAEDMISPVAADFMQRLLKKKFEERLGYNSIAEIKNHKFFAGVDWTNLKNREPPMVWGQGMQAEQMEFMTEDKTLRQ